MLYNEQGDKKIKIAPSLPGFIAWLETKNPNEQYNWCGGDCAVDQYLVSINVGRDETTADTPLEYITYKHPRTFGALLQRAREALSSQAGQ